MLLGMNLFMFFQVLRSFESFITSLCVHYYISFGLQPLLKHFLQSTSKLRQEISIKLLWFESLFLRFKFKWTLIWLARWSRLAATTLQLFQWHVKHKLLVDLLPMCSLDKWSYSSLAVLKSFLQFVHRQEKLLFSDMKKEKKVCPDIIWIPDRRIIIRKNEPGYPRLLFSCQEEKERSWGLCNRFGSCL